MRSSIIITLMLIGAACVLLLAGGFPLMGAPAVYRSGAVMLLGLVAALTCAVAGWRIAAGERLRLLGGLISVFFACAGLAVVWQFGSQAVEMARMGGPMWFGAVGMACTGIVGILFTGLFGFLAKRAMHTRLWLAGAHWALVLIATGAYVDYCSEQRIPITMTAGAQETLSEVHTADGRILPLDFTLSVEQFELTRYNTRNYSLHRFERGSWQTVCPLAEKEGTLCLPNGRQVAVADLHTAPGMPHPFLLLQGEPPQLIMQDIPPVREYRALCRVDTLYRGRPETRRVTLRVNEPLSCKGWMVYLMNYRESAAGTQVELLLRRAPGRLIALAGMVGLILCSAFWCWGRSASPSSIAKS